MSIQLYNPFENLNFDSNTCFLSGEDVKNNEKIYIFPEWMMNKYDWKNKRFRMLDKMSEILYNDLTLPCSPSVKQKFDELDKEIKTAFEKGYDSVKSLDSYKLFIWMGRIVYGLLYHDLKIEQKLKEKQYSELVLSPILKERYSIFHLFLQSIISPIKFKNGLKPWNISVVKTKYSKDICNYRDDSVNMMFTMSVNGFGIIGCLMDNETIIKEHQNILSKIGDTILHPIQFEELCAKFQYSSYLLDYKPKYLISNKNSYYEIETLEIKSEGERPIFNYWIEDTFATVLEGYFKPWGLTKKDIYKPPNSPISFLENEVNQEFINPETIKLPF